MKLDTNIKELINKVNKTGHNYNENVVKTSMRRASVEGTGNIKETISNFKDSKGDSQGFDTGHFVASIDTDLIEDGLGFEIFDGVPYGIFHEMGTVKHWVPFFDSSGNMTELGKWAYRNFLDIGAEATGARGKKLKRPTKKSKEEALRQRGGMSVQLDEMAPFRKGLIFLNQRVPEIFKEEFDKL